MQKDKVVMAFDFGLSRTGVAVGNSLIREARPLEIIHARTNDERWQRLSSLVREWTPDLFVVGVPRHGDGTPTELTARCERFARQVAGRFCRPVTLVDERFSSVVVEDGAEAIDDRAAAVILQQYFEEHAEELQEQND